MKIFIPIKEHSERVPNKNFREFKGKPLYQHVLYKYVDKDCEVWVDTDSEEIASWIRDLDKNIFAYSRPEHLRGCSVSVNLLIDFFVTCHCLQEDIIAQIHVTSPFLKPETVLTYGRMLKNAEYLDSIASSNLIQSRLWRKEDYGYCPVNHNPMKMERTQDLPQLFEENSSFYIFKYNSFLENKKRIGTRNKFVNIDLPENLDIDTLSDWNFCEKISKIF